MTRKTRKKTLPARDATGTLKMSTQEFALLLGTVESVLYRVVTTTMTYQGLTLPEPVNRFSGKSPQFDWNACLDFADRLAERDAGGAH
ncbi:hypothetical protein ASE93_23520 [Serratia sp. Leaf50]|nr:hypothetical protein ASE93_23520 [Serratia sp. Leaf50]